MRGQRRRVQGVLRRQFHGLLLPANRRLQFLDRIVVLVHLLQARGEQVVRRPQVAGQRGVLGRGLRPFHLLRDLGTPLRQRLVVLAHRREQLRVVAVLRDELATVGRIAGVLLLQLAKQRDRLLEVRFRERYPVEQALRGGQARDRSRLLVAVAWL